MFRYNRSHLSLVIAATSNCNFRCVYCYEGSVLRASTMSEAIQEAIVKFVESEAPHLETFTVTWYGGEPLLALDIIENLSIKFVDIYKKECHCLRCNNCSRLCSLCYASIKTFPALELDGSDYCERTIHWITECLAAYTSVEKKGQKLNFSNGIAGMADIYTPHNIV